jgi:hypothetical protein
VAGRKGTAGDEDVLDHVEDTAIAELDEDTADLDGELDEELDEDDDAFAEVLDDDAFAEDDLTGDGLAGDDLTEDPSAGAEEDTAALEVPSPADPVDDEEADEGAALPATVTFDDDEDELVAAVAGVEDDDDEEIDGLRQGEFVCRSCYMAKLETQLADAEAMLCRDCA